jgi:hypothetical protein
MTIIERTPGFFSIIHGGREVETPPFNTEADAWAWADRNIDDQMFDSPNTLAPPLKYLDLKQ